MSMLDLGYSVQPIKKPLLKRLIRKLSRVFEDATGYRVLWGIFDAFDVGVWAVSFHRRWRILTVVEEIPGKNYWAPDLQVTRHYFLAGNINRQMNILTDSMCK